MGDVIKINLNKNERNWENFIEKCLSACINRNKTATEYFYGFDYEYDCITISLDKEVNEVLTGTAAISLMQEEYDAGNKSDKDILDGIFEFLSEHAK